MIEKLIAVAENEVGYIEKKSNAELNSKTANAGYNNYTKYGKWYGLNGQPWCAMFVSWCADQAGIGTDIIPRHASCPVGANWFKNRGQFISRGAAAPKRGDIIYFSYGGDWHVGIVYQCDGSRVYTIEGNTSGGTTMVSNGGCTAKKSYALSYTRILGYGRPNYPDDTENKQEKETEEEMTQEQFNKMADAWMRSFASKEPAAWSKDAREWAEAEGFILGDERGNMLYKKPMTREEYVQMEYRQMKKRAQ